MPIIVLLASSSGCVIHEPRYQIIYTPDKPLTNNPAALILPSPALGQRAAVPALHGGVDQQAYRLAAIKCSAVPLREKPGNGGV
ncbi:MAG TPA: hypothetical protein VFB72_20475 [Verrucomicrobiae bacterium]|nr:hypothetical protein [Verrucomicrobiae bacterium]